MADSRGITDRKTTAQASREGEEKLTSIADAIPGAVYRFLRHADGHQEFEVMSRGVADLLDLDQREKQISLEQFLGYVVPEDAAALMESITLATTGPSPWSHQFRVLSAKGRIKWISANAIPEPRREDGSVAFNGLLFDITQQVEAEALQEATGRIAKIGGFELDVETDEVKLTDQVREIYEVPLDTDFDLETALSYYDPGEVPKLLDAIVRAKDTGEPWDLELPFTTAKGTHLWVRSLGHAERVGGKTVKLVGTFQDITDRKKTEQELRHYESITSNSNDVMALLDKDFTYLAVNQTFLRLFGMNRDDVVGHSAAEVWGNDFFESVIRPTGERCLTENTAGYERWFDSTTEGRRYMDFAYYPNTDENGMVTGFVVCGRDITQRKETADALARARRLNEQILEAAGEGIYGVDMAGRITFVNEAAAKMTGWKRDALLGQPQHEVLGHSDVDGALYAAAICPACAALKNGNVHRVSDEIFSRKDGSGFPVDYVSTPIREGDALVGAVVVFKDVTEARERTKTLSYQATHDSLTGLINRRDFERRLERVIETAKERRTKNVVAYLDLDQFKIVNDTCGHIAGDELLRRLPPLFSQHLRERDTLARLGGDEFGVLIEHCSLEQGREVMGRILETIAGYPFVWEAQRFQIGVSIGLVEVTEASLDITDVLKRADAACYLAKESGRNRIHVYDGKDVTLTTPRGEMQWVSKIEQALDEDRFELFAQIVKPVRAIETDELKYEVLVRIVDEDGTITAPERFMLAAERYGLAGKIDRRVIDKVLDWLSRHPAHQAKLSTCAINLSGHSLADEGMLEFVERRLAESAVPPEKICFEITETAAVANMAGATGFMEALRARGCQFALDDFGSGLSSFAYLKALNVDVIKIDGGFIKKLVHDPVSATIVRSINEIAHALGKITVAEFVEDARILDKLREIGVDYAQGYGISRPQPLDALAQ